MSLQRIAIVTGAPAPYREPVFAELARRPDILLKVFYCTGGHADVGWSNNSQRGRLTGRGYEGEILPNWTPKRHERLPGLGYANFAIRNRLRNFNPDYVIVYGYNQLTLWLAFQFCLQRNIPFALRSDSNFWLDQSNGWRSAVRRKMVSRLVRQAAAVLPVGTANREYWYRHGAVPDQVHMAPYAVDNACVAELAEIGRSTSAPSDATRFLYVGRLLPRKGVDLLVEAFNRLVVEAEAKLIIVGDGPQRAELQKMQSERARQATKWIGKLPNEEAMQWYGRADVFVLPSRYEPWGLVVNEAMAAGLPVIAHERCGAAIDLVENGRSGLLFENLSSTGVLEAMRKCVDDRSAVRSMGSAAKLHVQGWSFARTVDGFVSAFDAATSQKSRFAGAAG